jgi:hypothetical protein
MHHRQRALHGRISQIRKIGRQLVGQIIQNFKSLLYYSMGRPIVDPAHHAHAAGIVFKPRIIQYTSFMKIEPQKS